MFRVIRMKKKKTTTKKKKKKKKKKTRDPLRSVSMRRGGWGEVSPAAVSATLSLFSDPLDLAK